MYVLRPARYLFPVGRVKMFILVNWKFQGYLLRLNLTSGSSKLNLSVI